jgi:hypothetical protein
MTMKNRFLLIATLVVSLVGVRPVAGEDISADTRPDFNSFQVIERNNIFNPSRRPRTNINRPPPVRVSSFTLDGTISYENKGYAFFNGNAVNRSGVFGLSDTINGYKIAEITNNTVKLAASSNQFITLKVGMQMRKVENGPWKLVGSSEPASESSSSGSADTTSTDSSGDDATTATAPVSAPHGPEADVIARLQRRHREANGDTNSAPANGDSNQ